MNRHLRLAALAAAALLVASHDARAQFGPGFYPGGYGGYGWGGWGSGVNTVYGSNMQGLGAFAAGAGMYNQQTAVANSINVDTVTRWNEYLYESAREQARRYREDVTRQGKQTREAFDANQRRIREAPEERDIIRGDTLNALLREITAPGAYDSTMKLARRPVKGDAVREIPFIYAAEPLAFSLDDLRQNWPPLLKGPQYAESEAAFQKAADNLRNKVRNDEPVTEDDIQPALAALKKIHDTFVATAPKDGGTALNQARDYLRLLAGVVRMLRTPDVTHILAELSRIEETTVGDMIAFMHAFNLRFGPATTPRQREIYLTRVYPTLKALAEEQAEAGAVAQAPQKEVKPPAEVFRDLPDPTLFEGKHVPPAPKPNN